MIGRSFDVNVYGSARDGQLRLSNDIDPFLPKRKGFEGMVVLDYSGLDRFDFFLGRNVYDSCVTVKIPLFLSLTISFSLSHRRRLRSSFSMAVARQLFLNTQVGQCVFRRSSGGSLGRSISARISSSALSACSNAL